MCRLPRCSFYTVYVLLILFCIANGGVSAMKSKLDKVREKFGLKDDYKAYYDRTRYDYPTHYDRMRYDYPTHYDRMRYDYPTFYDKAEDDYETYYDRKRGDNPTFFDKVEDDYKTYYDNKQDENTAYYDTVEDDNTTEFESVKASISTRSLCPWQQLYDVDSNRVPMSITYVKCKFKSCDYTFANPDSKTASRLKLRSGCVKVTQDLEVSENGTLSLKKDVPVACMCARRAMTQSEHIDENTAVEEYTYDYDERRDNTPTAVDTNLGTCPYRPSSFKYDYIEPFDVYIERKMAERRDQREKERL